MLLITNRRRFITFILIVAVLLMGAWRLVTANLAMQVSGTITVAEGSSAKIVWQEFTDAGFTSRSLPWHYHAWRMNAAANIKAGVYQIETGERMREVIVRLVVGDVSPSELTVTFPEGFTLKQMAERLAAKGIGTAQDYITAARPEVFVADFPFLAEIPAGRDLEGYLFPDTYRVFADDTAKDVIRRQLATFGQRWGDQLRQEAAASGRTLDELVIMASIVEREVITDEDMAAVAGVLWKRNDEGAGLDADATVRYALDKQTGALTVGDLRSESLYNTRRWRGLPPGPISNPGLRALIVSVRPEESEFYYYLSANDGQTIFARTNDEHNSNKVKYLR